MPFPLIPIALSLAQQFLPSLVGKLTNSDTAEETAKQVVQVAQQVTGTEDPKAAQQKVMADPKLALEFQGQVMAHREAMYDKQIADTGSATDRDVQIRKLGGANKRADLTVKLDIVGLLISTLASITVVFYAPAQAAIINGFLGIVAGTFGTGLTQAHNFEFGSTRKDGAKDEFLAKANLK